MEGFQAVTEDHQGLYLEAFKMYNLGFPGTYLVAFLFIKYDRVGQCLKVAKDPLTFWGLSFGWSGSPSGII